MHEASIAVSVLEIASEKCKSKGYNKIDLIRLRIGRASGIMTDALLFALNAIKVDTIAEQARVIIDEVPVGGSCNVCKKDFNSPEIFVFSCPECGSKSFRITKGRELEIVDMEVSQ